MDINLQGKRILLICPVFYKYHSLIIEQLEDFGAEVFFYPERKDTYLFTLYNNFNKNCLKKYQDKHYQSILNNTKNITFDFLFVIRGFMFPAFFINQLKSRNKGIKTVMSQWDANKVNPYFHLVDYFDRVYSFDYQDCDLNKKLIYRPLFYTKDLVESKENNKEIKYDYFFMGAYMPERYHAMLDFKKSINENNLSAKMYMYIPFKTYVKEIFKGKKFDKEIINIKPLDRDTYLSLLCTSRVMVDVSNKNQSGLAMRVIEAVGAEVKILTNNRFIKREKMYNNTTVKLYKPQEFSMDKVFLDSEIIKEIDNDYYSLKSWLLEQLID